MIIISFSLFLYSSQTVPHNPILFQIHNFFTLFDICIYLHIHIYAYVYVLLNTDIQSASSL